MANRKWIFGSLCLVIGFVIGQLSARTGSTSGQSSQGEGGIPLAIASPAASDQESAELNLTDLSFCHKISSFGNYATYARDEFAPDQPVFIYAEIEGIESEPLPDGNYRIVAKSKIEVFHAGDAQELVESIDLPESADVCRRARRDYFLSYQFTMPENMAEGDYILKLSVKDQLSDRQGSRLIAFSIK